MINYSRCHLDSQLALCALQDTIISPASYACLTSQNTLGNPFDCALSGPFDKVYLA